MTIYLNNATTAHPRSPVALAALHAALTQPPRDLRHSAAADADLPRARALVATRLGVGADSVFFTADATLAINHVLRGTVRPLDHVLVDNRAHSAVTRTLHNLDVEWSSCDFVGLDERLRIEALLTALRTNTRLVVLTHASNVSGAVYALEPVIATLRALRPELAIAIDACQSAGLFPLAPLATADFLVFSGHKALHGLPGAAVLVARRPLRPFVFGGTGVRSNDDEQRHPEHHHLEVGTPNLPAILALAAVVDEAAREFESFRSAVAARVRQLWDGLEGHPSLQRLPPPPDAPRTGVLGMTTGDAQPERDWIPYLAAHDIIARGGLQCAPLQHRQLALAAGTLRLSVSRYTSVAEIDRVLEVMWSFPRGCGPARAAAKAGESFPSVGGTHASDARPVVSGPTATGAPETLNPVGRLVLLHTTPCADLPGAVQIEGELEETSLERAESCLRSLGWSVRRIGSRDTLFARHPEAQLYWARGGGFTLSRLADEARGRALLAALVEALRRAAPANPQELWAEAPKVVTEQPREATNELERINGTEP